MSLKRPWLSCFFPLPPLSFFVAWEKNQKSWWHLLWHLLYNLLVTWAVSYCQKVIDCKNMRTEDSLCVYVIYSWRAENTKAHIGFNFIPSCDICLPSNSDVPTRSIKVLCVHTLFGRPQPLHLSKQQKQPNNELVLTSGAQAQSQRPEAALS